MTAILKCNRPMRCLLRKSKKNGLLPLFCLWLMLGSLCFLFISASTANAQRRDFAGTYQITDVLEKENDVQLTLSLTVHNFSSGDIKDCGIIVSESGPPFMPIGSFDLIKFFPSFQNITVTHRFAVSKSQYVRWQQGVDPILRILLPDGEGGTRVESIDAHRDVFSTAKTK